MRARELLMLVVVLATGTAAWWLLAGGELEAPPEPVPVATEPPPKANPGEPGSEPAASSAAPAVAAWQPEARQGQDTKGWTSGVVRGDVQIAVSILDRIQSISVVVEELRNPLAGDGPFRHPHRQIVPVRMDAGTPTFEVRGIPFSEHAYSVRLYSPGLNGGQRTVVIDQEHPLHEDLLLSLTPGAPFSVLLRDQDLAPLAGHDVQLVPIGDPPGRPGKRGTTDNFGAVVFGDVMAGDYRALVLLHGTAVDDGQIVTVPGDGRMYGNKVQGQSTSITVQRGVPLEITVLNGNFGLADAQIRLMPTDQLRLVQIDATTDVAGKARFPRLLPGIWQIDIWKDNFERTSRQLTIKKDEPPPPPLEVRLFRIR
ncbi:MAG: hypothetical protein JNK49_01055 [Planctomycetes bacterium]|nr:hypothetical protein [Planctomycetota bacterium]